MANITILESFNKTLIATKKYIDDNFDFSVSNIIKELDLLNVEYYNVAAYGHFGRNDLNLPWERIKK